MDTLPPYKINVYNRASENQIGSYRSNQIPREGDFLSFVGYRIEGDPFDQWGYWKVDLVVWITAGAGSPLALSLARSANGAGEAVCTLAEVHVWPASGPFHINTPKWAKAVQPPNSDDRVEP
jgi:hypothetical protein